MKLGIIPYQEGTDIVYKNALQGQQEGRRPNLPQMEATHQIKSSVQGTSYEFVRTEDIPWIEDILCTDRVPQIPFSLFWGMAVQNTHLTTLEWASWTDLKGCQLVEMEMIW